MLREHLGFLDRGGADEDRLAGLVGLLDLLDDGAVFLLGRAVDLIVVVDAGDRLVGRDLDHAELVDLEELVGLGGGGAGHAGELFVEAEVVLEGDRGEGHVLGLDRDASLASIAWCSPSDRRRPLIMRPVNSSISTTSSLRTM
jgi:hypothetical protein